MSLQQAQSETKTTRQAEHSPLPWHLEQWQYSDRGAIPTIISSTGKDAIAQVQDLWCMDQRTDERNANAAYIVKACNEYPKLLQALKEIEAWAESRGGSPESDEKALSEISEIATQAQLNANG